MAIPDPTTPGEVWYPIPSLPGYQFSSDQRLRRPARFCDRPRNRDGDWTYLNQSLMGKPEKRYLSFAATVNGKRTRLYVHNIVAELAYGPKPPGMVVCHARDESLVNFSSTVRYGTRRDNSADAILGGRIVRGTDSPAARLSDDDVRSIRLLIARGWSQRRIGAKFGVSSGSIGLIARCKTWLHVH
jgi:hypothetical protein